MSAEARITETATLKVARLARLELSPSEVSLYTEQLNQVLQYFEDLNGVDVSTVEPLIHPLEMNLTLREDLVEENFCDREGNPKILGNAPETVSGGFKVPPVL